MDIVITVPKRSYKDNLIERQFQRENECSFGFRIFKNIPKKINIGDRIYFVKHNRVEYSKEIFNIQTKKTTNLSYYRKSVG